MKYNKISWLNFGKNIQCNPLRHVFKFPKFSFNIFNKEFLLYQPFISPKSHISTFIGKVKNIIREKYYKIGILDNDTYLADQVILSITLCIFSSLYKPIYYLLAPDLYYYYSITQTEFQGVDRFTCLFLTSPLFLYIDISVYRHKSALPVDVDISGFHCI